MLFDEFHQAKIQNLCIAITRDHDVVWLEVAMNNPGRMSLRQPFGHLCEVLQELL